MMYRIQKYNASASPTPAWRWKIQFKRGRLWRDFKTVQGVKVFEHPVHAENYMKLLTRDVNK
jgi:hypothetical protein